MGGGDGNLDQGRLRLDCGWIEVSTCESGKLLGLFQGLVSAFNYAKARPAGTVLRFTDRRSISPEGPIFVARRILVSVDFQKNLSYREVRRFHSIS